MLTHILRQCTQPNAREKVDAKSRVFGIIRRKDASKHWSSKVSTRRCDGDDEVRIADTSEQLAESNRFRQLLKQNLDENARGRGRVLFSEVNQ